MVLLVTAIDRAQEMTLRLQGGTYKLQRNPSLLSNIYVHRLESNTIDKSIRFTQPYRPYLSILTHVWVHCIKLKYESQL